MQIGELARRSKLSRSRIRFYEARGLLPKPRRRDNGYRDYPQDAVTTLRLIDGAQDLGFSLQEIKAALTKAGSKLPTKPDMLEALRGKLMSLDLHIEEAARRRRQIVDLIVEFESHLAAGGEDCLTAIPSINRLNAI